MAAGAFVSGSSIELSADGPMKEPYAVYFQGGLTWEHAKYGYYDVPAGKYTRREKFSCRKHRRFGLPDIWFKVRMPAREKRDRIP